MIQKMPRTVWGWLAVLSPSVVIALSGTLIPNWVEAAYHVTGESRIGSAIDCGLAGIFASSLISLGLGYWMARDEVSLLRRCEQAIGYGIVIEFLNISIGFAGCMAVVMTRNST